MTEDAPELPLLSNPRVSEVVLIESADALRAAIVRLGEATGGFALDAERASGFKYSQRAYLIQVHREGAPIYLIDPIAVKHDDPSVFAELAALLASDEWILHAASQDIPCLRELGLTPKTIFDTELGARLAGLARVGLGAVTEEFLKIRLAKEHSAVDWSIRPLHEDWLNYAALDVDVLIELRAAIAELLMAQGKAEWANQEFAAVAAMPLKTPKQDRWRGMTGMHEIKDARAMAIARDMWLAREELAAKLDVSPGRLIPDSSIITVAKTPPKSKPELAALKTFNGRASRTYLDTWWNALAKGMASRDLPEVKLPNTGMPNHRTWANRFPEADARLKATRAALLELAEELKLPTENLLTPDFLRQLCFEPPKEITADSVAEKLAALGARPWQTETCAAVIAEALIAAGQPAPVAIDA